MCERKGDCELWRSGRIRCVWILCVGRELRVRNEVRKRWCCREEVEALDVEREGVDVD